MVLSVLSALARLDTDPWKEAAELAGMSIEAANQRMASLIELLPDAPTKHSDSGTVAARLVALLPSRSRPLIDSGEAWFAPGAELELRGFVYAVLLNLLVLAGMLATQWVVGVPNHAEKTDGGPDSTTAAVVGREVQPHE